MARQIKIEQMDDFFQEKIIDLVLQPLLNGQKELRKQHLLILVD